MTTISSRDFNQDVGKAKRLARQGPVFITDRGRPSHVLMSFEAFRQISGQTESIIDLLAMSPETSGTGEFGLSELEPVDSTLAWDRASDFEA
jgi:PHD/YefM family antitoxin component YafN of YafNO toxin-antitoxin module